MAVAVEMNFRGATTEQYDQIIEKMGLTPRGATPPGAISHWVAKTDDGMTVVDVWETREAFDQYATEKIFPYSAEAGITEGPRDAVLRGPQLPDEGVAAGAPQPCTDIP